jgi:hypothetical protein
VGLDETRPGGMAQEHKHDTEEEVMFFFSGRRPLSPMIGKFLM